MTSTETPERDDAEPEEPEPPAAELTEEAPAEEKLPFWQRPMVDRYLTPLLLPPLVVFLVVFFAANISRIFLSGHGDVSVLVGSLITIGIIAGAALLSAAPKMRTGSLALVGCGALGLVMLFGWLSLGHAEEEGEGGELLAVEGPVSGEITFESNNNLRFVPSETDSETGIFLITLNNAGGQHTLHFVEETVRMASLEVAAAGDSDKGRAFFGESGDYEFYCEVPGHREAGMHGIVHVDGDTVTVEQIEAEGGGEAPAE